MEGGCSEVRAGSCQGTHCAKYGRAGLASGGCAACAVPMAVQRPVGAAARAPVREREGMSGGAALEP